MLLESLIAAAIGMTLVVAATTVFCLQLQTLREAMWRQRRERDLQDMTEHIRREWRRAGWSQTTNRTAEHDGLALEGSGASLQVHYRNDPSDPSRPAGRSTFRLSQSALQWRTPSTGGFQQITDPQLLALPGWTVQLYPDPKCRSLVEWAVFVGTPVNGIRRGVVRRRNEGGSSCNV